ncbi:aspartate/glutamate racemase family protein [Neisseria sp. Dent CA1/247]|uniref:aspartate/glutamate racemase family protein n=1 Tax=Neisseria sp. Dent CA1/247 TaxID=2912675 RepID=UPI001FD131CF|nr:aspartate/glutamate racemase family protein [Neisseria sp. Dent CA1/247]UOO76392.1 aspartate/glutamate racemase family protein [Neisseria sp. Dent CA1/247]
MKTIGIIGGMSAESTVLYYQIINRETNARLGGNHSADIVMHSVDFEKIVRLQKAGDWAAAGAVLAESARKLEGMGADVLVLATNTMHKIADVIEQAVRIPLLHVVDATAAAVKAKGLSRVGLLGTRFTMSDGFYSERMAKQGVEITVPSENKQAEIHRIIFEELCLNKIQAGSKAYYQQVVRRLQEQGAEGVILGCTEIGLLLKENDCPLPLFDSAEIHALAAVNFALS